jgi:Zn-dependent alcohol dehydrogenase
LNWGATHAIAADTHTVAEVRELTQGGAQHSIETVGSARVLEQAYSATRRGGSTISCGLPDPNQLLSIPAVSLVTEERTLRGSYMGSSVPSRDIPRYVALYRNGQLPVDRLLSHRLGQHEINLGMDRLARGEALRQVVVFDSK